MKDLLKNKAILLRRRGFSFKEISEKLEISKSTASLWSRDVELSKKAKERIIKLGINGRENAVKTVQKRIKKEDAVILKKVKKTISKNTLLKEDLKMACALLYWCEGGKTGEGRLAFINSDPKLIKYFVDIFRKAFEVDEKRFRALIHVHNYHNINSQTKFWSNITGIPKSQFTKPFVKPNTGKRKKDNYQGCVSVRYYGNEVSKELMFLINEISK